jgi:hypothetical protein
MRDRVTAGANDRPPPMSPATVIEWALRDSEQALAHEPARVLATLLRCCFADDSARLAAVARAFDRMGSGNRRLLESGPASTPGELAANGASRRLLYVAIEQCIGCGGQMRAGIAIRSRCEWMRTAARLVRENWPAAAREKGLAFKDERNWHIRARLLFPGVLELSMKDSGQRIARSLPACLDVVDPDIDPEHDAPA